MSHLRLWTFQSRLIVPNLLAGQVHYGSWPHTPQNFRLGYRWMADRLRITAPEIAEHPPIWAWHSCQGVPGQQPTVGVACGLLSEYDIQQGMVVMELLVPPGMALLSSYYGWNRFLDVVITKHRLPRSRRRSRWMFEEPLLRHEHDDIQAVIPTIDPRWIRHIEPLIVDGRDWAEPVFAAR